MRTYPALALGLAVTAALLVASPAPAQPGSPPPVAATRHTVTLITGDVVEVRTLGDGNATATLRPGAERANVSYASRRVGDQLYVVPADAMPLLAAGKLDGELFNITALLADGYDDARSATLPLIVQYERADARAMAAPLGTTARHTLESINARSVAEHKDQAGAFWKSLAGAEGEVTATAQSVRKIWLNRTVRATLSDSVPQVGAPRAWAAGFDGTGITVAVLDTGIDDTHPDLDGGKVVAAENFSDDADTLDHFGHGTHVASIVAGTGEAAPAARRGVAPGAQLINAKVLNSNGSGTFDQIIEGLEWAAAQGAEVANMSLGTQSPSDGTNDPLIEAVDAISRSSGMLIVVAAGNLGNGESTIASPGWADEALTVGAVSKRDALAGFSSRGPRLGDFGIKPDLTAPGVGIVAARAEGTTLGPIVDETYQQLDGTSMATPHVAGAAAILAQRFPGHTNRQLKDALISTASTKADQTVYQQGGGRLDVARAHAQQVYAGPGTLNLGFFSFPHDGQQPVTKTVTYTNATAADLTLDLALNVSGKDSGPAPAGMFTVSSPTVTVPAGGTASVDVSVDPNAGPLDLYGGYLTATAGDVVVHTSVGAYVEPEMYDLTVTGIARDGRPAAVISWAELWSLQTGQFTQRFYSQDSNTVTFRVRPGTYSLVGYLATADAANTFALEVATVAEPQLEITADRALTLDARTANPITLDTPKPAAPTTFTLSYHRDSEDRNFHSSFTLSPPISRGYASPTATVTEGGFEFYSKWDLVAPRLLAKVTRPEEIPLDPQPMSNAVPVDGRHTLPLVYVGLGKPADYTGRDVQGKIALISRGEITFAEKVANATKAGAWAALIFNNRPGVLLAGAGNPGEVTIRGLTIEQAPGLMLVDMLQRGPVRVQVSGTAVSPYAYDLLLPEPQRIPPALSYTVDRGTAAQIDTRYTADVPGVLGTDVRHISRPWPTFSVGFVRDVPRPLQRTYLVSANDTRWWHIAWSNAPFDGEFSSTYVGYEPRQLLSETWFGRVSRPGASALFEDQVSRTGDEFTMALFPHSDSGGHYGWNSTGDVLSTKLFTGTQLLKETDTFPFDTFPALATPARYRLELSAKRANAWSKYSTDTFTTWVFSSSRPAKDTVERPPLPQVDVDLTLDELNRTTDRTAFTFRLRAGYVPGATGPGITRTQAWVSFNDGGTWRRIDLVDLGTGWLQATVQHPRIENTTGAVSLRVRAADDAGNSVDQTLLRAYGLKPAT
ncbi:MAG TPA: S8 family serine peptidase [Actinophytocola sp.]|uniref:S8 family serine peptidase n=1 Tax=Actinophytocola sp. TaxID=1872138 RepID=UPI002DDD7D87|nr:S8 family serine peptidase [Actinophytocola sp.]HEV2782758.1 S8 family serine peptidase [Actinophytocola sp.]